MTQKRIFHHCFVLICVSAFFFITVASPDNYKMITNYFIELDENFDKMATEMSSVKGYKKYNTILQNFINQYPAIDYVVKTNKDGERTNRITRSSDGKYKVYKNRYKFIGSQKWYKVLKLTRSSYYNGASGKSLSLFWGKPLIPKKRFNGVIAMQLDLRRFFEQLAEKKNVRYRITYGGKIYFSNLKDKSSIPLETSKLAVFGMPGLTVTYEKPKPKIMIPKKNSIDTVKVKKEIPKKVNKKPLIPGKLDTKTMLILGGGTFFIFIMCIILLTTITKKQAEKSKEGNSIL